MPDCSIDGCTRPVYATGWCSAHYTKNLRYGTPTPGPEQKGKPGPKPDPSKPRSRYSTDNPSRSRPKKAKPERTHCKHGHELTEENRYWHKTSNSWVCRVCAKSASRRYRETKDARDLTKCKNGHEITPENTITYSGGSTRCRECVRANGQSQRLKKYDLSPEAYADLLAAQDGCCAVCGDTMGGGRNEHIDHDHETGVVRGLLCTHCNTAIGKFRDDPERLLKAATYLRHFTETGR